MSRGVRQAFLCCTDLFTHQSYDDRGQWISDRLKELIVCYSTDCCGYAVISNHYHLVLFVDHDAAKAWTLDEVIERWQKLFKGSVLVDRYRSGQNLSRTEWNALSQRSEARRANQEDRCSGRFWEGRQNPRPCWMRKHWRAVWPMWI
jgi:hypothetical protein